MSKTIWVVKDTQTNLYLKVYDVDPHYCEWGNDEEAITYPTIEDTEPVIETLGSSSRFIGTNPPPH